MFISLAPKLNNHSSHIVRVQRNKAAQLQVTQIHFDNFHVSNKLHLKLYFDPDLDWSPPNVLGWGPGISISALLSY